MFIFAVCRRKGSALCSVAVYCSCGHFPELAYLREDRASNHQLLWCKCQVGGAGEVERLLLTSEAGRDINLGPAPEYSLRPRPGGCRHAEAGPRTPRPRQRLHPAPARPPHGEDTTWQRISSQFVALYSSVDNRYSILPVGAVPRRPPEPAGAGAPRPQRAGQPGPGAGDGGWPRAGVCPV